MSDMLNEKFEEFASEHAAVLAEAGQDPMPTVTAAVLPGDAAASGQSNTAVNAKAAAGEGATGHAAPLQPGIAIGQKAPAEVKSVTTTPHEHDEDGDEKKHSSKPGKLYEKGVKKGKKRQSKPGKSPGTPSAKKRKS